MKIKDLIKNLQKFDPDQTVIINIGGNGYNIGETSARPLWFDKDDPEGWTYDVKPEGIDVTKVVGIGR